MIVGVGEGGGGMIVGGGTVECLESRRRGIEGGGGGRGRGIGMSKKEGWGVENDVRGGKV